MSQTKPDARHRPRDNPGPAVAARVDSETATWRREVEFFESIRAKLFEDPALANRFVAIRNEQIVDSDADELALARRVAGRYPGEVVLVAAVELEPRVARLPSPRLIR